MSVTNVPAPTFGPTGFIVPTEAQILAGVQLDQQAAFGGDLAQALNTPQGQLASSQTACLGDAFSAFCALANGVDPAFATGRMQDAIARIYFLTRNPAQSTVVTLTCAGKTGTVIPINARAADQAGNIYLCTEAGTIPSGGSISLTFACQTTGPIAAPAGYVNAIYQAIPGWDSVTNPLAGVLGNDVETRADFEYRRQQSVSLNAQGITSSILANVLATNGVLDAYAMENPYGYDSAAIGLCTFSGTTLTVATSGGAPIVEGMIISGLGIVPGTVISSFGSGTGGVGTYTLSLPQVTSAGSTEFSAAPGGVDLIPHSIYIVAYGGNTLAIAQAIFEKKNPGCSYNGSTTVTVQDTNPAYTPPYPSYQVTFDLATPTPILFNIQMQNNAQIPANAVALIQDAVIAAFTGADGGNRARIGGQIIAGRFYAGIAALGTWAQIYSVQLGIVAAAYNLVQLSAAQIPTIVSTNIAVTFA